MSFKGSYFWENKPLIKNDKSIYTFTLIPTINKTIPESDVFQKYYTGENSVVTFNNRSGDAILVVPKPQKNDDKEKDYGDMYKFLKNSTNKERHQLFITLGKPVII